MLRRVIANVGVSWTENLAINRGGSVDATGTSFIHPHFSISLWLQGKFRDQEAISTVRMKLENNTVAWKENSSQVILMFCFILIVYLLERLKIFSVGVLNPLNRSIFLTFVYRKDSFIICVAVCPVEQDTLRPHRTRISALSACGCAALCSCSWANAHSSFNLTMYLPPITLSILLVNIYILNVVSCLLILFHLHFSTSTYNLFYFCIYFWQEIESTQCQYIIHF